MSVDCWLVKEAMSSLSSSGAVVSVPVSVYSLSGCARTPWLQALSVRPARSHCSLAATLGLQEGIFDVKFPSVLEGFC